jgi:Flp pilus assembly protein TadD
MSRHTSFRSAISLIAMSSMLAGCATPQRSGIREVKQTGEVGLATRAMAALNAENIPMAIDLAEQAVARTPDDAGFRALLGSAYFAGGRFASAEAAYKDSLSIYGNQPQVMLKLVLVEIAQGKNVEATGLLNFAEGSINPADFGLALALAGHKAEAIRALQAAARQPGADSRVRQNLALAYAFAGDWVEARTVAAQDVPANQLDARIQQWMQLASPKKASDQVASLIGVTPAVVDPGQPVRLALRKGATQMARADSAPLPVPAAPVVQPAPPPAPAPAPAPQSMVAELPPIPAPQPRLVEVAPTPAPKSRLDAAPLAPAPLPQFVHAKPAPAPQVAIFKPVPPQLAKAVAAATPAPFVRPAPAVAEVTPAPVTVALVNAAAKARNTVQSFFVPTPAPAPAPKPAKPRRVAAASPPPAMHAASGAVVQLGAYSSPQRVSAGWNHLTARYPALRAYLPMRARVVLPKGIFWRLSISGFANQREAIARCQLLKSRGGACFVRKFAGDAPVQYASR